MNMLARNFQVPPAAHPYSFSTGMPTVKTSVMNHEQEYFYKIGSKSFLMLSPDHTKDANFNLLPWKNDLLLLREYVQSRKQ